ncbi:MAG TPA: hypothetical protein PKX90_12865, partial [bacterium]|nr:hypothetical protein [bacterium]
GLMAKFTFSIFKYSKLINELKVFCDIDKFINYGFLYIVNFDIYSYEFGLIVDNLSYSNFI